MKELIIGLGNPEDVYTHTYHNAGRWCVNVLAGEEEFETQRAAQCALAKKHDIILAKSLVAMNKSGQAVKNVIAYTNAPLEAVTILHDDTDLTLGQVKIQTGRGSGGHHGVDSVFAHLGTENIRRVRLGVRPPRFQGKKADEFVLKRVREEDYEQMQAMFQRIEEELGTDV